MTENTVAPIVTLTNNQLTTTSQNVAEVFGKEHKNVIRDIEKLQGDCPADFNALNFEPVEYTDAKGEKRPMYTLTRDGLTLLVMGYTGKRAMEFKIAYIEAFNRMEAELKAKQRKAQEKQLADERAELRARMQLKAESKSRREPREAPQQEILFLGPEPGDIAQSLCMMIVNRLEGIEMREQIEIWNRVKAVLEGGEAPAEPVRMLAQPSPADFLPPVRGKRQRNSEEGIVARSLQSALDSLDKAYMFTGFLSRESKCPVDGLRQALFISCHSGIDAAGAMVRALLAVGGATPEEGASQGAM